MAMSKRLQVILADSEMKEIRTIARRRRITVAEWVRSALRAAKAEEPATDPERKLQALRQATSHSFPTADIEEMLAQIERGYSEEPA
jgi:predicted 2-oxoglutarate/Fe(II)-dependent dioxygenase YbiX